MIEYKSDVLEYEYVKQYLIDLHSLRIHPSWKPNEEGPWKCPCNFVDDHIRLVKTENEETLMWDDIILESIEIKDNQIICCKYIDDDFYSPILPLKWQELYSKTKFPMFPLKFKKDTG
ncbi:TPA_asm: hypothetical protein vir520_00044 [Caudoviricetes sp. vir520]|nr:TPA_asm: hypothetical protein vir520_00044 [Caudoviricetes sp. vir520]